ncbi:MAG: ATP-dependent 6-phosphofructokinase [Proteobacteria bacterium]|nr:ATP-dependent 6-phosphofructokinase [Pseudomonadota bacterium]MBU2261839.1 ATP-dependent 6-phosphofructokinase [Pseudomonadota bacterium]
MDEKFSYDFTIPSLEKCTLPSPVSVSYFTTDAKKILFSIYLDQYDRLKSSDGTPLALEVAGPREKIFFDPSKTKAAIVTCGGLCPGINDVIRALVLELHHGYGVRNIIGIKYGFQGLIPKYSHPVIELTTDVVKDIHTLGGSILSSSRGRQDPGEMVDALKRMNVDLLFCVGGDGTMRATELVTEEIARRNLSIGVIGIPKTIDNDLNLIQKTFGFDTAISESVKAIQCAHVESKGAPNGIGLVKIMGRQSGHIAAGAALAQSDVNFVLIPEAPFDLEGAKGLLKAVEKRLRSEAHCVILVAEGAGQEYLRREGQPAETDASGNPRLFDIGVFLKSALADYFQKISMEVNIKYIDPSYLIRSVPANASDSMYCSALGQYAVHAGMAGKTGMLVGLMKDEYVHIPLKMVGSGAKVDTGGNVWLRVLETTGQPPLNNV